MIQNQIQRQLSLIIHYQLRERSSTSFGPRFISVQGRPQSREKWTRTDLGKTLRGIRRYLPESENASPTAIQRATLLTALRGKDILAAAKTGSGKTLAFLIPLLEKLWTERWTNQDSTAAVVLSPTRELAMQTYDVLRTIAIRHDFSASLIIGGQTGGKNFKEEAGAIGRMNIIIATPGIFSKYLSELFGRLQTAQWQYLTTIPTNDRPVKRSDH